MAQTQKGIAARVETAIKAPLAGLGYDVWDVEYVKEGSEWYLRITIDSPDGIDIDDCEKAFRIIDPLITEMDPVENAYHLEVSSPGLERDLRTIAHFKAFIGKDVRVKLFTALNGRKEFVGRLTAVDDSGTIRILCPEEHTFEKSKISRANAYFDFDALEKQIDEQYEEDPDDE